MRKNKSKKPGQEIIAEVLPNVLDRRGSGMLAVGIVRQAMKEWKEAKAMLKKVPDDMDSLEIIREVEIFFRSPWYRTLREFAPDVLPKNMTEKLKEIDV